MALTLEARLERSNIKRQIAENMARTKVLNYTNENLQVSRKRKLGWTAPGKPERDMSRHHRHQAMAMARQKVEENPIVQAIVNARLNNIVGHDPRLRMKSGDNDWDTAVEDWWMIEKNHLDIRGLSPWGWMARTWQARHDIDGDVGVILIPNEGATGGDQLSWVQTVEAEYICRDKADTKDNGIEFDEYGMPLRYFVKADLDKTDPGVPYPRENFALFMNDDTYRVSRARGISKFLQVFAILQDHADIMDGIVQKVKNEAFIGLKFWMESSDGNPFGPAQEGGGDVDYTKVKMTPGMNLVLGEGENADVMESKSPHAEFDAFEKKLISRIALPFGFTYELLTGDYAAINDRTARVMLKQFEKHIRAEQAKLGMLLTRVFRWSLSRAVNAGVIAGGPDKTWFNHTWGFPGFPYINPLQEAQANEMNLHNRLTSRIKILAGQGDDVFDDVIDEQKYEEEYIDGADLHSIQSVQYAGEDDSGASVEEPGEDKPDDESSTSEGVTKWLT